MGMHEYEKLVEESIRFLDRHDDVEHVPLFKSLYLFQNCFDTGNTKARVADILIKRGFAGGPTLTETDAAADSPVVDPIEVAEIIANHVDPDSYRDRELLAWWCAVIPIAMLLGGSSLELGSARDDISIRRIHELAIELRIFDIETDYGNLRYPSQDVLADMAQEHVSFMRWWFDPVWKN